MRSIPPKHHDISVPTWAVDRGLQLRDVSSFDIRRTALLIIDMQTYFVSSEAGLNNPYALGIVPNINRLSTAVRAGGGLVILTQHAKSDASPHATPSWLHQGNLDAERRMHQLLQPGSPEFEVHPDIVVAPTDVRVIKYRPSAFHPFATDERAPNLHAILKAGAIDTVLISGTLTNGCCETTARDAWMFDFQTIFLSDATAALTDAEHQATLLNMAVFFGQVISTEACVSQCAKSS